MTAARFKSSDCHEANSTIAIRHRLQSYLELLRLPNVFTAVADVAMGFCFVQAAWAFNKEARTPELLPIGMWTLGLLIASSASLYLAGMVLNDLFDVDWTARNSPTGHCRRAAFRWPRHVCWAGTC